MDRNFKRSDITDMEVLNGLISQQKHNEVNKESIPLSKYMSIITIYPQKLCASAIERCCDNGYIDYGISLNFPWITEEGKEYIAKTII